MILAGILAATMSTADSQLLVAASAFSENILQGTCFGPTMLLALYWRRCNRQGVMAGMVAGAITIFLWKFMVRPLGGAWNIYELLPAFLVTTFFIVVVSLITKAPEKEITDTFDSLDI